MNKFNIGDKVKLRDDLTVEEMRTTPYFTSEMWNYWGVMYGRTVHTIKRFTEKENYVVLEGDRGCWSYHPDWLELVEALKIKK